MMDVWSDPAANRWTCGPIPQQTQASPEEPEPPVEGPVHEGPIDVNAVVSYNLKAIRERRGWAQQQVADRLARITGHRLPQASISAMERGFDGARRRRFDAHELYLLSVVFDVPIAYFFLPPPGVMGTALPDTGAVAVTLYTAILGDEDQLQAVDERLAQLGLNVPDDLDPVMATILGADPASMNWHDHFRTWRSRWSRCRPMQPPGRLPCSMSMN
jgi:transcriptional regulator with XRE-family HTH domain